jgi:hypothetical protein
MYALLSYPAGIILEAVIVSRTRNRMRAVAAGLADALELKRTRSGWLTESGETVELEFVAAVGGAPGEMAPVVAPAMAAGSSFIQG